MRADKDYMKFGGFPKLRTFVPHIGYIPKEEAPQEIKEAIFSYDSREFGTSREVVERYMNKNI